MSKEAMRLSVIFNLAESIYKEKKVIPWTEAIAEALAPQPAQRNGFDGEIMRTFPADHAKSHDWSGEVVRRFRNPEVLGDTPCKHCGQIMHVHGWIDTLEGGHIVCPGDWIITGVQGEHYPCKPDIFEMTYEGVE